MSQHNLFVYGTLQPGQPNAHLLESIGGSWTPAFIRGHFDADGWDKTGGYPAVRLDPNGPQIRGHIFASEGLPNHWERLDDFEGEAYQRRRTTAFTGSGESVRTYIYTLNEDR